jgi:hypothetical protein
MPKGVTLQSRDIGRLLKKFKGMGDTVAIEADAILRSAANSMENNAVRDVPVDEARLKGVISTKAHGKMNYEVVAPTKYAGYMEFGTKKKARIPAGLESIASQFRGPAGGTFKDLLKAITAWVKRKGISGTYSVKTKRRTGKKADRMIEDLAVAYPIAFSIAKNGVAPHQFFFHNYYPEEINARKELKKILKEALNK